MGDPLYQELKAYRIKTLISTLTFRLGLSVSRSNDVHSLVFHLTSASFAVSESFLSILTAAFAYVIVRRNDIPISLPEAAGAVGCEECQITRMLFRVLRFLDDGEGGGGSGGGESSSHLPHFGTASALSRMFKTLPAFSSSRLDSNKVEQMASMGQFLIRCAGKWFLSTGRRLIPLVAVMAAFVVEINGVEVPLEEIAKGIYAVVSTSRLRLREFKEALVRVARNLLSWGQDMEQRT
ncbi:plant-specific TFIIB-related protein PTF2 [Iris pallida]|uniref:Plant-specific TFIIB-related protein PTF2 n=1 Tax=Iris pallida TaxID=29817 RepID=A0AAX6EBW5_IRIPA|nr:plant-specific TFIIB-related protein PTF2 [Iris pallida]